MADLDLWVICQLFDKSVKPPGLPYDALGMVAAVRYYNMALAEVFAYLLENKISLEFRCFERLFNN